MTIETWDEVRTAWTVVRAGTVSGAAEALGVHHATVIRHIDALEQRLGVKLFQRHPRGYTPTEAGLALAEAAQETDLRLARLAARLAGLGDAVEGELIVTTLPEMAPLVLPALADLAARHPDLRLTLRADPRVLRLELGEAQIAVRAGARPSEADAVVQPWQVLPVALFAAPAYLERRGRPASDADLAGHDFVGPESADSRAPFFVWLARQLPGARLAFRSDSATALAAAVGAGLGLGFQPVALADPGLETVLPPRPDWAVPLWLVSHVDLHRSPRVQAGLAALKAAVRR